MPLTAAKTRWMLLALLVWFITGWLGIHGHIAEKVPSQLVPLEQSSLSVHLDLCEDDAVSHAVEPHVDVDMGLDHLVLKFFSFLLPALVVVFCVFLSLVRVVPEWLNLPLVHFNSVLQWRPLLRAPPRLLA